MDRNVPQVKGQRTYDASGRRQRALRQHSTALAAARVLFLERGYAATTVESIATAGGVSAATIYKSYGGKAGLVRELGQRALAGAGPVPAEARSNSLRSNGDPRLLIEGWGRLAAEVSPRLSPLLLLLRTAAQHDSEAAALYEQLARTRLRRMADNARHLVDAGHLRVGVTAQDAVDILWLCSSPELYELVIIQRRWTLAKFSRFVTATMIGALL